jgi:hypothetical protein
MRFFNADQILDNVPLAPVGDAVVGATASFCVRATPFAHVLMHDLVAKPVERAVIGRPPVFDPRVSKAHVVDEFILEILQQHHRALLPHKVHALVAIDIVARGKRQEHVKVIGLLAHLTRVFVKIIRAYIPERFITNLFPDKLVSQQAFGDDGWQLLLDNTCLKSDVFVRYVFVEFEDREPPTY